MRDGLCLSQSFKQWRDDGWPRGKKCGHPSHEDKTNKLCSGGVEQDSSLSGGCGQVEYFDWPAQDNLMTTKAQGILSHALFEASQGTLIFKVGIYISVCPVEL